MVSRLVKLRVKLQQAAALGFLGLASCGTPSLYAWGSYDASVAAMYRASSGYDPAREVARLADEIERTQNQGKLVPPGVRAHVGYLLIEAGNAERGVSFLLAEKTAFPESATFIDGMLARLRQGKEKVNS